MISFDCSCKIRMWAEAGKRSRKRQHDQLEPVQSSVVSAVKREEPLSTESSDLCSTETSELSSRSPAQVSLETKTETDAPHCAEAEKRQRKGRHCGDATQSVVALYSCDECGKRYRAKSSLQTHVKRHAELSAKPFQCKICKKGFQTEDSLGVHALQHANTDMYDCTKCSKRYTSLRSLHLHMYSHTGQLYHPCPLCPKVYRKGIQLKGHMMSHTVKKRTPRKKRAEGVLQNPGYATGKKHRCDQCEEGFATLRKLFKHQQTHAVKTTSESEADDDEEQEVVPPQPRNDVCAATVVMKETLV